MPFDVTTAWAALLFVALALLPGAALMCLLRLRLTDGAASVGLAVGASLALQPLVYLWADLLGLSIGAGFWWFLLVASGAVLVIAWWVGRRSGRGPHGERHGDLDSADDGVAGARALDPRGFLRQDRTAWLALGAIVLLVLASRWWAVHDVAVPLWGDSVHHTMIVQLFAEQGGLPADWEPLAPLSSFSYHFGLHAGVASLAALSGLPAHRALLLVGQLLTVLQVLTAYALVSAITGRRWAGVGAAIVVAGLSPMPAYYTNWGRYTQLAGQVLLPAAALGLVLAAGRRLPEGGRQHDGMPDVGRRSGGLPEGGRSTGGLPRDSDGREGVLGSATTGRRILLASILAAGLGLTHYLVAVFFVLFVVAWLALDFAYRVRRRLDPSRSRWWRGWLVSFARVVVVASIAAVLAMPWLVRMSDSVIVQAAAELTTKRVSDPEVYGVVAPSYVWGQLGDFVGWGLVAAVGLAAWWGLLRRDRTVGLGVAWSALLLIAAYPSLLGIAVTGVLKDFAVAIGLYVPASLIVGGAVGEASASLISWRPELERSFGRAMLIGTVGLVAVLVWGDRDVIDDEFVLVHPADERAMIWIQENTPAQAVFLATCGVAYGGTVCAGQDAGWWIPMLAQRRTTVPPITVGLETTVDPGYRVAMLDLARQWQSDADAPVTRNVLREAEVTHAYAGTRPGTLDREEFELSPYWRKIYDAEGVMVFEGPLDRPVETGGQP